MIALDIKIKGNLDFIEKDVERFQEQLANQIVIEARRIIDESNPSGRVYRRGGITAARTARGINQGFRPRGKSRMIVGSRFHRASAKGQPPAKDTGKLYRQIKVARSGRGKFRVTFGAEYAGFVEFTLNRPFVLPAIEAAVEKVFNE